MTDANNWKNDPSVLYRGGRLEEAMSFLEQNPRIGSLAIEFIDEAKEAEAERIRLAKEQEDRIQRLRRVARLAGIAVVVAMIVGMIAGSGAYVASQQAQEAQLVADNAETQVVIASTKENEADARAITADAQVAIAGETLTPIPEPLTQVSENIRIAESERDTAGTAVAIAGTAQNDALQQSDIASTAQYDVEVQAIIAGESLDEVATQQVELQNDAFSYQMAGQAQLNQSNENDALAFAFEAMSNVSPPIDVQPIFYDIAQESHNRATLTGHDSTVRSVAFSPDGKTLASASDDRSIKLWDVASGDLLATLTGHDSTVWNVAFSPDGTTLASASDDTTVKLWNISSLSLIRQWVQENRYLREFTCEERARFNMPVPCDAEGNFPRRTPYPTPSPMPLPSWTPFWTPLPTATMTPVPTLDFTPFYADAIQLAQFNATGTQAVVGLTQTATLWTATPTPTITPTLAPTFTPVPANVSQIGENIGDIAIGGGVVWIYEGQAGEVLTIRVNPDNPAQMSEDATRVPDGFDSLLIIRNPDGSELAMNDDIEDGIQTNSLIENLVLTEGGIYEVEVRSWDNRSGGAYMLVIESVNGTETTTPTPTLTATL